ncbi:MAG: serine hydrolase [Acidobacteria bacterium]|nr:serine hydrolase [Acidobacteriota bacterium]
MNRSAKHLLQILILFLCGPCWLWADIPVSGEEVPELSGLDTLMLDFMAEFQVPAANLGVMRNGTIVYQRGFGWSDAAHSLPIPADAPMRIASVTKPVTAAGIRILVAQGLDLNAHVFDLGQPGGGILHITPFPSLGDARLADITVNHCLLHRGGWDRDLVGDLTYMEVQIAQTMGIPSPPSRTDIVRYILGQPLQHDPGQRFVYSNIGYLVLGLVLEEWSGQNYMDFVFPQVFGDSGIPASEIFLGRTFPIDRDPREPVYDHYQVLTQNVYDPNGPLVLAPDGGWNHEARTGQGRLVSTVVPLLYLLEQRQIYGSQIGTLRTHTESPNWRNYHTGSLAGTNSLAMQRGDGINYVVLLNQRSLTGTSYTTVLRQRLEQFFNTFTGPWPNCILSVVGQPQNMTTCPNGQATFTVMVQGEDVTYQWQQDGLDIPNANQPSLLLTDITATQAGAYTCNITNPCGSITSKPATLTLDPTTYQPDLLPTWRQTSQDPCTDPNQNQTIEILDFITFLNATLKTLPAGRKGTAQGDKRSAEPRVKPKNGGGARMGDTVLIRFVVY